MPGTKLNQLIIHTKDLTKAQRFYSILGVNWIGGLGEEEIGVSGLPISLESSKRWKAGGIKTGFPDLLGDLGDIEVAFILNKNLDTNRIGLGDILCVEVGEPDIVAERLRKEGLFFEAPNLCALPWIGVLDPDGRQIILSF
jgi:hypothetical protein